MSKLQTILNIIFITVIVAFGGFLLVKGSIPWAQTVAVSAPSTSDSFRLTPIMATAKKSYSISGLVRAVTNSQISFTVSTGDVRTVNITGATKITRVVPVDPQVAAREAETVQKYLQNPKAYTPEQVAQFKPTTPQEISIALADVKVGAHVVIIAEEDIDVVKDINALGIKVQ